MFLFRTDKFQRRLSCVAWWIAFVNQRPGDAFCLAGGSPVYSMQARCSLRVPQCNKRKTRASSLGWSNDPQLLALCFEPCRRMVGDLNIMSQLHNCMPPIPFGNAQFNYIYIYINSHLHLACGCKFYVHKSHQNVPPGHFGSREKQ